MHVVLLRMEVARPKSIAWLVLVTPRRCGVAVEGRVSRVLELVEGLAGVVVENIDRVICSNLTSRIVCS